MDDISISVSLDLDADGFLNRECPTCEQTFRWFSHEENDPNTEHVDQYFCPLCGVPAGVDSWWTTEQLDQIRNVTNPELGRHIQDLFHESFKGISGITFTAHDDFDLELPTSGTLGEIDEVAMVIVESPCHPNEPVKVPERMLERLHCLVCGSLFAI